MRIYVKGDIFCSLKYSYFTATGLPMINPGAGPSTSLSQIPLPDSSSNLPSVTSSSSSEFKPAFGLTPPLLFPGNRYNYFLFLIYFFFFSYFFFNQNLYIFGFKYLIRYFLFKIYTYILYICLLLTGNPNIKIDLTGNPNMNTIQRVNDDGSILENK